MSFSKKKHKICAQSVKLENFATNKATCGGVSDYPQSHDASIHQASQVWFSLSVEFKVWLAWLVCPLVSSVVSGWLTNVIDGSVCLSQIGDFGARSFSVNYAGPIWKWQMMTVQFGNIFFKQGHVYVRKYTVFHFSCVSVMTHRRVVIAGETTTQSTTGITQAGGNRTMKI